MAIICKLSCYAAFSLDPGYIIDSEIWARNKNINEINDVIKGCIRSWMNIKILIFFRQVCYKITMSYVLFSRCKTIKPLKPNFFLKFLDASTFEQA